MRSPMISAMTVVASFSAGFRLLVLGVILVTSACSWRNSSADGTSSKFADQPGGMASTSETSRIAEARLSELTHPLFLTTSMVAVGPAKHWKYEKNHRIAVIAVGVLNRKKTIGACGISSCHTNNDYLFPITSFLIKPEEVFDDDHPHDSAVLLLLVGSAAEKWPTRA